MSAFIPQESLQGWTPELGEELTLSKVIDLAFDYRGDVTVDKVDGRQLTGYLYNRDASARRPFVQIFERDTGDQITLAYEGIVNIRFTGRDAAAGQSYEAWKARRGATSAAKEGDER